MLARALRTTLPRRAAAALSASSSTRIRLMSTAKKEESLVDVVKEYGPMSFVGLGSAILVSKELFMVNEEVLVLGIFSGVIFYGYVTLYDDVSGSIAEYSDGIRNEQVAAREKAITDLKEVAENHKKFTGVSVEIKNAFDHLEKTSVTYCGALNVQTEQAKINELEAQLQDLADAEAFIESYQKEYILKTAAASLNTYLEEKLPQKEKDNFFKWAVDMLEGKGDASKGDFVTSQFKKEVETVLSQMKNKDPKTAAARVEQLMKDGYIDDGAALKNVRKLANM
eukprot:CAMPEP_0114505562 /NCGR_PEP_ID=MMETSP0109-20121206/10922_1 /TAXON_ID=29199 /ORGANISM="Chlorarachnion reptans, Strain CCCM449" /LENGTH=281 /DNA_ID=CAMNT_0001684015 /DNA_START=51 /DNA_END=896 /DNA_ORIENTATION=-